MTIALNDKFRFTAGRGKDTWVQEAEPFAGLDEADRKILSEWLPRAGVLGVDAAMDLSVRPWAIAGAGAIVGVFEVGKDKASWLVVQHALGWILARCEDGSVSDVMMSLQSVLALIDADRAGESLEPDC